MGGQQGVTSHFWSHLAVTQDEMRQDGEHGFARGALDTPDGEPTQAETGIVGVARQAPTRAAAGLMGELEAQRKDEGEDKIDKRLGVVEKRKVGRLIVKVDGDGPVVACRYGGLSHVSPPVQMAMRADETW